MAETEIDRRDVPLLIASVTIGDVEDILSNILYEEGLDQLPLIVKQLERIADALEHLADKA